MKDSEICVPLAALALPGEKEGQTTPPAVGDSVDISGTATVTRIEGDQAYLAPETINGAEVRPAAPAKEKSLDDEEAELGDQARKDEAGDGEEVY